MSSTNPRDDEGKLWPYFWRDTSQEPDAEPPITRHILLPEIVAVRYIAEVSGQDLRTIVDLMSELRIIVSVDRSVSFEDAAMMLRRYGIEATKQG